MKPYLEFNRRYGTTVLSGNNSYSDDNPGFAQYTTFSIFENKVLTDRDIQITLGYYNTNYKTPNAERRFGPFTQKNLNMIADTSYNTDSWKQAWNNFSGNNQYKSPSTSTFNNVSFLYKIAYQSAVKYTKNMNQIIVFKRINTFTFSLAKHKVIEMLRSTQNTIY